MKRNTQLFIFFLLGILFSTHHHATDLALATDTSSPHTTQSKKLILFGIKDVLFFPDLSKVPGGKLTALFGLRPEVVEREFFDTLRSLHVNGLRGYTGTYPELIEAWLTNQMSNQDVQKYALHHIKRHCGLFKKTRLKITAEYAFSPYDSAKVLSVNRAIFSLAQNCKSKGHSIALCSSWNSDSFNAAKQMYPSIFGLFDTFYTSGDCGMLACESRFYEPLLKNYKAEDIYLIDFRQENLAAAKQKGIKTIYCADALSLEHELREQGIL